MKYNIAVIHGDGIGPEVVGEALKVLDTIAAKYHHEFVYTPVLAGGCAIDAVGECLPQATIDACKAADAVLLGAVGGWKWDTLPGDKRPERACWDCVRNWNSLPISALQCSLTHWQMLVH